MHLVIGDILKDKRMEEIVSKVRAWVKECRTSKGQAIFSRKQRELGMNETKLITVWCIFY